jgi:diguanylate cyclase (GGDEF)-like protein
MASLSDEPLEQDPAASDDGSASPQPTGSRPALPTDDQTLSDRDQTSADTDQTGADTDQTSADGDQTASERDQRASDGDQDAADRDQAAGVHYDDESGGENGYARTRRARSQGTHERDVAARAPTQTALVRDEAASHRDRMATERDAGARARDDLAATIDADIARVELERSAEHIEPLNPSEIVRRAAGDRQRAAASRTQAAAAREAADRDRDLAAEDREQAARDRIVAAEELAAEGVDILTGAMRRRVGLAAIQRELDRTSRSGEPLVVAFVDVDGLKSVNDTDGHPAGDELLRDVVSAITEHLRSYDVIARFGGDEFVCSLAGQDAGGARKRFDQIRAHLSDAASGATFTVGLAERGDEEALDQLVSRADTAMIEARQHPDA